MSKRKSKSREIISQAENLPAPHLDEDDLPPLVQPERGIGSKMPARKYREIVLALSRGKTHLEIAMELGCSGTTVSALSIRHKDLIPDRSAVVIEKMEAARNKMMDNLIDRAEEMGGRDLSIGVGILSDKISDIQGKNQPAEVHNHLHIDHKSVGDLLSSLPGTTIDAQSSVSKEKEPKKQ